MYRKFIERKEKMSMSKNVNEDHASRVKVKEVWSREEVSYRDPPEFKNVKVIIKCSNSIPAIQFTCIQYIHVYLKFKI